MFVPGFGVRARGPMGDRVPGSLDGLVPVPTYREAPSTVAFDITGIDLDGRAVEIAVVGSGVRTLILFLSSSCHGCAPLWGVLTNPGKCGLAVDDAVVAVTRDPSHEDVTSIRGLVAPEARIVMSDGTWHDYRVQGPPFFALIDGRGKVSGSTLVGAADAFGAPSPRMGGAERATDGRPRVLTEGVVWGLDQLADDVRRAIRRTASRNASSGRHSTPPR